MSTFIDRLESRMFLSVSPAVVTLHTDEATMKTDLITLKNDSAALIKTIKADLKTAGLQKTDKAQVKALVTELSQIDAAGAKAVAPISKVNAAVNTLESDEAKEAEKPGNVRLLAKISKDKDKTIVGSDANVTYSNANYDFSAEPAIKALASGNGAVGTDASTAVPKLSTDAAAMGIAVDQAFTSDLFEILGTVVIGQS